MRIVVLIVCVAMVSGCGETYRYIKSGEVGWRLKKEVRDNNAKEVNLVALVPFEWDELFLFGPYQPSKAICAKLSLSQIECESKITRQSTDDSEMLMVFRKKGQIVHVEMHFRFHGDFTPIISDQPITPKNAVFVVTAEGSAADGRAWLRLKPKVGAVRPNSRFVSDKFRMALRPMHFALQPGR